MYKINSKHLLLFDNNFLFSVNVLLTNPFDLFLNKINKLNVNRYITFDVSSVSLNTKFKTLGFNYIAYYFNE